MSRPIPVVDCLQKKITVDRIRIIVEFWQVRRLMGMFFFVLASNHHFTSNSFILQCDFFSLLVERITKVFLLTLYFDGKKSYVLWRKKVETKNNIHPCHGYSAQWHYKLPNTIQLKSHNCLNGYFNMKIWFPGKWAAVKWQRLQISSNSKKKK